MDVRSWVTKNWYFWTVVLERTLENHLDYKEIKPFNPQGNQSWIGRTDVEAETPILWPPGAKNWLIGEDLMLGKIEDRRRRGRKRVDVWMASPTQWIWATSGSWWWTGKPGVLEPSVLQRVGQDWATELNWNLYQV